MEEVRAVEAADGDVGGGEDGGEEGYYAAFSVCACDVDGGVEIRS